MREQILQSVGVEFFLAQKIKQNARIKVARACSHRDAARGREPHRRINGHPVLQRAKARSVPEMSKDRSPRQTGAEVIHQRLIGKTMKAVPPNAGVEISTR